ncbi:MAG: napB [Proteobacteria bacterium]|jgi:cytochrome c-type protein NapB|nr:napB [Pseudomonadota bacterium]
MNKFIALSLALLWCLAAPPAWSADEQAGMKSLRGDTELTQEPAAPVLKSLGRDSGPIPRNFVMQPPLIPHAIEGYRINQKFNKCLTCHSWANYQEAGATKISQTHFEDRYKHVLSNVSARRYFCTQCHVPQVDAPPLVENTFEPVKVLQKQQ